MVGRHAVDGHISAQGRMQLPEAGVAQGHALDEHGIAAIRLDERRAEPIGDVALLGQQAAGHQWFQDPRPVAAMVPGGGAGSIQGTTACERDVLLAVGVDHRRVVHALDAFIAGEHERVLEGVTAEHQRGAWIEVQVHVALEVDSAGHVRPGRHHDVTAA